MKLNNSFDSIINQRLFYAIYGFITLYFIDILLFNEIFYTIFYLLFLIEFLEGSYFLPDKEWKSQMFEKYSRSLEPLMYRMQEYNREYYTTIILTNLSFFLMIASKIFFAFKIKWYMYIILIPKGMEVIAKLLLLDKVNAKIKEGKTYYQAFDELSKEKNLDVFWPQDNSVEYIYVPLLNASYLFFLYLVIFKDILN